MKGNRVIGVVLVLLSTASFAQQQAAFAEKPIQLASQQLPYVAYDLTVSSDRRLIYAASRVYPGQIPYMSVILNSDLIVLHRFPAGVASYDVEFSQNGKVFALGMKDGIRIFNTQSWDIIGQIESADKAEREQVAVRKPELLAISPDGSVIVTISAEFFPKRYLKVFSSSGQLLSEIREVEVIGAGLGVFSPDGRLFAILGRLWTHVLDTSEWTQIAKVELGMLEEGMDGIDLRFAPDSDSLVAKCGSGKWIGGEGGEQIGVLRSFDARTGALLSDFSDEAVLWLAEDGGRAITGEVSKRSVKLWDLQLREPLFKTELPVPLKDPWIQFVSPNAKYLIPRPEAGKPLRVWSFAKKKWVMTVPADSLSSGMRRVDYLNDHSFVVSTDTFLQKWLVTEKD